MSGLAQRLREYASQEWHDGPDLQSLLIEAADRIEELEKIEQAARKLIDMTVVADFGHITTIDDKNWRALEDALEKDNG